MEITYIGHSCFKIKGDNVTLVIDPYDEKVGYKLPKLSADVLLTTHDHFDHNNIKGVSDYKLLIDGPGEFETNGIFVYGRSVHHDGTEGKDRGDNTIYLVNIDGFDVLHLGDLGHELNQYALEKISNVDILMIPVGGTYTINAKTATKVISALEPGIVIPMHYKTDDLTGVEGLDDLDNFLDEMGIENGDKEGKDKLVVKSKSDIPEETEIVILKPAH
ncbi:MBL fold metallo-hydrolase [Patescibacteria group bacterium]|nr:MBL fold metallo-hydrolase [Patescibacteria group bacterium]